MTLLAQQETLSTGRTTILEQQKTLLAQKASARITLSSRRLISRAPKFADGAQACRLKALLKTLPRQAAAQARTSARLPERARLPLEVRRRLPGSTVGEPNPSRSGTPSAP